ncbi:MAG: hypothetical protein WB609_08785 [Candidatus Cybelea sp.]
MRRLRFELAAVPLLLLCATAGCGSAVQLNPRGSSLSGPRYATSWISPDAKRTREILFESDLGYGSVEMFSLPKLKLEGVVTGFSAPGGMCSDTHGNVYVENVQYPVETIELSHEGKVLRTIGNFYATPVGCAVNPINDDLAVANIEDYNQPASVWVFPNGESGYGRWLRCSALTSYYYAGYDPQGHLFVDGGGSSGVALCRGADDNHTLTAVKVKHAKLNSPGMVQWYDPGKYLVLGDPRCSCIRRISITGDTGRIIGSTKLLDRHGKPLCNLVQGAIEPTAGMTLLGGDAAEGCGGTSTVDEWPFPGGGVPPKYFGNPNFINEPAGTAVSIKS